MFLQGSLAEPFLHDVLVVAILIDTLICILLCDLFRVTQVRRSGPAPLGIRMMRWIQAVRFGCLIAGMGCSVEPLSRVTWLAGHQTQGINASQRIVDVGKRVG